MSRKKLQFTEEELFYAIDSIRTFMLSSVSNQLLNCGAEPSGPIGMCIMHFHSGANINAANSGKLRQKLQEAALTDTAAEKRLALLEEIIRGESK